MVAVVEVTLAVKVAMTTMVVVSISVDDNGDRKG